MLEVALQIISFGMNSQIFICGPINIEKNDTENLSELSGLRQAVLLLIPN